MVVSWPPLQALWHCCCMSRGVDACNVECSPGPCAVLCMQDMNEVLMLDTENSGGYAEAGAQFTFADRSGSSLPNESLDAAAQIAEVMSVYSSLSQLVGTH